MSAWNPPAPAKAPPPEEYKEWLGHLGEQWFGAICAAACLRASPVKPDIHGVDFEVSDEWSDKTRWQVKATESPDFTYGGSQLSFPLSHRRLSRLTGTKLNCRSFLCVVVFRSPHPRWTGHVGGELAGSTIMRAAGYFLETTNHPVPPTTDKTRTETLAIPTHQLVTPAMISGLYEP